MGNYRLILPLYVGGKVRVQRSGKRKTNKRYWLTMNNYRNWHYQISNKIKVEFKSIVEPQVSILPDLSMMWGQIHLHYIYFPPNRAARDLMNVVSVVDKFFQDALVECGKLEDDDLSIVPSVSCNADSIDTDNPRMEVLISAHNPGKHNG